MFTITGISPIGNRIRISQYDGIDAQEIAALMREGQYREVAITPPVVQADDGDPMEGLELEEPESDYDRRYRIACQIADEREDDERYSSDFDG